MKFLIGAIAALSVGLLPADAAAACSAQHGQLYIDQGSYQDAVSEFTCVIAADPTGVEGYRGRIEARLLLGSYSDAVRDYARLTAVALPVHPDAASTILSGYADRLAVDANDRAALTGQSFAQWWFFQYSHAIKTLNHLLDVHPLDLYGTLFRGSSRVLSNAHRAAGIADLDAAIALAPHSADVRFIVADAYTYGLADPDRALAEATLALHWGLDTPRVRAILGAAHNALGHVADAAAHIHAHLAQVTTTLVTHAPLADHTAATYAVVPGLTLEVPIVVSAGSEISIRTWSNDFGDTILALLAPDGTPVLGSDDEDRYFAAFKWVAPSAGTYRLRVTSFEGVATGALRITRR